MASVVLVVAVFDYPARLLGAAPCPCVPSLICGAVPAVIMPDPVAYTEDEWRLWEEDDVANWDWDEDSQQWWYVGEDDGIAS